MRAPTPERQSERLEALEDLGILDTDPETDFDDVVRLAARICGAPMSAISLIDAERQWFKSESGLGVRETSLDVSICAHALGERELLEIGDTQLDVRTADNPFCQSADGVRFYAGAVLRDADGLAFGSLCVMDRTPRALTDFQREALRTLARQIMGQLDLRRALRRQAELRREVGRRTRNALRLLSALAQVQRDAATSDETWAVLDLLQSRIATVERLVERLDRSDPGAMVDLGRFVGGIADLLQPSAPPGVALEVLKPGEPIRVPADQAAAVGVLLNEFAVNAFRHAFPDQRPGVVLLSLRRLGDGRVEVECVDDGVGLPDDLATLSSGHGLKIVEAVAMGLMADVDYVRQIRGLSVRATFAPKGVDEPGSPAGAPIPSTPPPAPRNERAA